MKNIEINPSDYTTDEIYTAFNSFISSLDYEFIIIESLVKLEKMYKLIQQNLKELEIKESFKYQSTPHDFYLCWDFIIHVWFAVVGVYAEQFVAETYGSLRNCCVRIIINVVSIFVRIINFYVTDIHIEYNFTCFL